VSIDGTFSTPQFLKTRKEGCLSLTLLGGGGEGGRRGGKANRDGGRTEIPFCGHAPFPGRTKGKEEKRKKTRFFIPEIWKRESPAAIGVVPGTEF